MNILLLEDNSSDADLTRRRLENSISGCKVEIAPTVKQAKEMLKKGIPFDIALLDMQLPDGTGLDILMEIRLSGLKLPVIMLTGSGNEEVATTVLKAGADDYVIKQQTYIENLPGIIDYAIKNFHQKSLELKEIIDVLYIEHHSSDIDLTRRHMNQFAPYIRIDVVATAEEALKQIAMSEDGTCKCKVILLDYLLPGINALEFIKIIRQELKLDVPIILVTGQGSEEIALQALKLGANDYMVKRENYLYRLPLAILNAYQHSELIKKQAALAESESKYRLLADNSGDVIFTLDLDLNYTYISPAIISLRGYEPEEAKRQKLTEVLTPESYQRAIKLLSESLYIDYKLSNNPIPKRIIELEMIRKDQSTIWTEVLASLIIDRNNNPVGILGATRDISKRKAALDELRKLSRAVEQSPDSILITNTKAEIEYINPALSKISGYTLDELIGKNPRIFNSGETPKEEYEILWNTIQVGKEWEGEFHNKTKNGELYWELVTISPILDEKGKIIHYLAIRKNITEQKQMTQELIHAKEHAEESDRLKSAFLANMSHEIRTPMNGILGFAELLKEADLTSEQQQEYIRIIEKSGARMLNIINDIVDISKIESGQMKLLLAETNVNQQIEFIYEFFKTEFENKGIALSFKNSLPAPEAIIKTDREKFFSILTNIVKNAIKYTPKGSVEIGYEVVETRHDLSPHEQTRHALSLQFFVKDTGIGIPKHRQEAIFERFIQADIADKMARQGAGLGLAISKAYVEMLGGRIWVESEVGVGSTFHFTLPFNDILKEPPIEISTDSKAEEKDQIKPLKILIVEDDEGSTALIKIAVRSFSKDPLTAKAGDEAVEICLNNPDIDLVLMDIKMPEMDGYEATRQIRQFNTKVIIIAQTAFALAGDREKAIEAGCNDYIAKPIKRDNLIGLVEKYFKKY